MSKPIQPITMPKWGIEMQEGTITQWHVSAGQSVTKGDDLLDVETEKIVNAVEAPVSGTLRRILAEAGETHAVGTLIAVFADSDVSEEAVDEFVAGFKPADASFEPDAGESRRDEPAGEQAAAASRPAASGRGSREVRVSPIARRLAEKLGVDLTQVEGTGRNGRISKEDVEAYAARSGAAAAAAGAGGDAASPSGREKLTSMRATIARRLLESSRNIPHYRVTAELEADALIARRAALVSEGTDVSLNDLLVKAVALALTEHPMVNAQLVDDEILHFERADVAVAVATDSGLVAPVVRGAESKALADLARELRDLVERARSGKLTREELGGGTFTVSNLGPFGITHFDAIINPPQVAILAVGAAVERIVARDGAPAAARIMTVSLASDHRVVDGAVAAAFIRTLKGHIEQPDAL